MRRLPGQKPDPNKTDDGLEIVACSRCGAPVIRCRLAKRGEGLRGVDVEIAPRGDGDIGIPIELFATAGPPVALELGGTRSRYRLHGPRCPGPRSFSRPFGGGKVR